MLMIITTDLRDEKVEAYRLPVCLHFERFIGELTRAGTIANFSNDVEGGKSGV